MSGSLEIRTATVEDLDAILEIEQSEFGVTAWSRDMLREEITGTHRRYLVVVDDGSSVRGYGGIQAIGEDGDIQTIALAPEIKGTGQGRRLMNALLDEAGSRGVRQVFLEVREDNPVARSLYLSLGFTEIGVRQRYYQPGDIDAVVMKLEMGNRR